MICIIAEKLFAPKDRFSVFACYYKCTGKFFKLPKYHNKNFLTLKARCTTSPQQAIQNPHLPRLAIFFDSQVTKH